ncbi:MAG TPA: M48 family metallopeptidase [Pyrinomonadaceae bacterium]|nr:M48 family metallopeptidase [Pyrinomonadaceae bacterium]
MNISSPTAHRVALCLVLYLALYTTAAGLAATESGETESLRVEAYRANLLTTYEERIVGQRLAYLYEQRHVPLREAAIEARLDKVKARLRAGGDSALPELEIKVIRGSQPGAVSFPPGYVYITSALLKLAATDDELAAVIAHEAAHITNRDMSRMIAMSLALPTAEQGSFPTRRMIVTGQAIQFAFPQGLDEARLRCEMEADKMAVGWMERAGYSPHALAQLLEAVRARLPLQAQPERVALKERVILLREESFLALK